jgi:hypothetical protein
VLAHIDCTDGTRRPVYEDGHGRQYVLDDLGEPIFGLWLIPRPEVQPDVILDDRPF